MLAQVLERPLLFSKPSFPMPGGSRPVTARPVTTKTGGQPTPKLSAPCTACPDRHPSSSSIRQSAPTADGNSHPQQEDWRSSVYYAVPAREQQPQGNSDAAQDHAPPEAPADVLTDDQQPEAQGSSQIAESPVNSSDSTRQNKSSTSRPVVPPLRLDLVHKEGGHDNAAKFDSTGEAQAEEQQKHHTEARASRDASQETEAPAASATPLAAAAAAAAAAYRTDPAAIMRAAGKAALNKYSRYNAGATLHVLAAVPTAQGQALQPAAQAAEAAAVVAECTRARQEQEAEDRITQLIAQQAASIQASAKTGASDVQQVSMSTSTSKACFIGNSHTGRVCTKPSGLAPASCSCPNVSP